MRLNTMKNICSIGLVKPMPTASKVYNENDRSATRKPKASKVYRKRIMRNVFDPYGVADGNGLCFSTNLVSLRDLKTNANTIIKQIIVQTKRIEA